MLTGGVFIFWQGSKIAGLGPASDRGTAVMFRQDDGLVVTRDGNSGGQARTWKEGVFWDQPTRSCERSPPPGASSGQGGAVWAAACCCCIPHAALRRLFYLQLAKNGAQQAGNTRITMARPEETCLDVLATKREAAGMVCHEKEVDVNFLSPCHSAST